jgi:hypothetical protein
MEDISMAQFDDAVARLAVHAYVLSIPLMDSGNDLIALIGANSPYFVEGGKVIQFLQAAGAALEQGALAYKGPPVQQMFLGLMPVGLSHLPGQVDAEMRSQGIAIGSEFLWLSQVLPPSMRGDYQPYQSTATSLRRHLIAYVQTISQLNPALVGMFVTQMRHQQPLIEQAVYNLVCQLNIELQTEVQSTTGAMPTSRSYNNVSDK